MPRKVAQAKSFKTDLSAWNFILFLTLAFILLVVVLTLMKNVTQDVRSRAGFECPVISPPTRVEDCPGGYIYKRDPADGCIRYFCQPITPTTTE
jgi:hypothetical protein